MQRKLLKSFGIGIGALLCATLGIFASDTLRGIDGNIMNMAGVASNTGTCPQGATAMVIDGRGLCVDTYEASPSAKCPHTSPRNIIQSEENTKVPDCYAASVADAAPWSFISLTQAQRMCADAGKRLPTSQEWYRLALGTESEQCIITTDAAERTGTASCVSSAGIHDAIGSVWEWVDETVTGTTFGNRTLPEEGYVTSVDADGVAISTGREPNELYGRDYIWSGTDGVYGMIRGGFYGGRQDAGLYTINASVPTSFASQGVGFRCVRDIL